MSDGLQKIVDKLTEDYGSLMEFWEEKVMLEVTVGRGNVFKGITSMNYSFQFLRFKNGFIEEEISDLIKNVINFFIAISNSSPNSLLIKTVMKVDNFCSYRSFIRFYEIIRKDNQWKVRISKNLK